MVLWSDFDFNQYVQNPNYSKDSFFLTWSNFKPNVDKWSYSYQSMGEIAYLFPNLNGAGDEVGECIFNFILHYTEHVASYQSNIYH